MTRYLLDTNVLSDLVRGPAGVIGQKVREVGGARAVYTSIVAAAELRFGAAKRGSERLTRQLELVLEKLTVVAFEHPADRVYAELRAGLERAGTPIGANELWIAAQALQDQSVLVTDNVREFGRVPGLRIENWLRF